MLDGNTAFTNNLFFDERTMRVNFHVRHQIFERVIPANFVRAKDNFALIRMAVTIRHFAQCTIAQYSTNDQAKIAVIKVGSFEVVFGDILLRFRWKVLSWPKCFVAHDEYLIALGQLRDGHPLVLFVAYNLKFVIGGTFQIATIGKIYAIDVLQTIVIQLLDRLKSGRCANLHSYLQVACRSISMLSRNKSITSDTRIHTTNILVVPGIGLFIVAVNKHHTRLRRLPGRGTDQIPQLACRNSLPDLALPGQLPVSVIFNCLHEGVGDADGEVGVLDLACRTLDCDKLFNVGMRV